MQFIKDFQLASHKLHNKGNPTINLMQIIYFMIYSMTKYMYVKTFKYRNLSVDQIIVDNQLKANTP